MTDGNFMGMPEKSTLLPVLGISVAALMPFIIGYAVDDWRVGYGVACAEAGGFLLIWLHRALK